MSSQLLPPLPPDLAALVSAEIEAPSAGAAVRTRVAVRLATSIATGIPGAAGPEPSSIDPASAATSGGTGLAQALAAKPAVLATVAFALGAGSGIGVYTWAQDSRPPPPAVTAPAPEPQPAPQPNPVVTPLPVAQADADTKLTPPPAPPAVPTPKRIAVNRDRSLAAERAAIEQARTALSRGDAAGALVSLRRHRKRFARGRLSEERDALFVQALVRAGRPGQARRHATRFKKRYPKSLFGPVVDAAAGSLP